ncbi:hypothetical protein Tco_0650959 [Tanacetum coccineum]
MSGLGCRSECSRATESESEVKENWSSVITVMGLDILHGTFWRGELLFLAGKQGNTFDADVDNQPESKLSYGMRTIFSKLRMDDHMHMLIQNEAKKAQPALYDGDELLKPHHVPVIVPSFEEELELAEATRNKLHVKMNDSVCVEKRISECKMHGKNLLITNVNLIAECLSKDVFYTATNSVLNVSRFSDMHDAFTIAQKRIAGLESENFYLRNRIQNDDHDSMIKHFSKLEVEHFNLQLKYQNLKERFGNKKPVTSSDAPSFDSLFVIGKLNEQIQSLRKYDLLN